MSLAEKLIKKYLRASKNLKYYPEPFIQPDLLKAMEEYGRQQWNAALEEAAELADELTVIGSESILKLKK